MALCWSIQETTNSSFFVLWVLVIAVCGVENSSSSEYSPGLETTPSLLSVNNVGHYIHQRSPGHETFLPLTSEDSADIDSLNQSKSILLSEENEEGDIEPKEGSTSYEVNEDEIKSKHNKQQKFNFNSKNYSNSKIASNESNNEKQKLNSFVGQGLKYNNLKKELKLSPDNRDQIFKSNLSNSTLPGSYTLENRKPSQLTDLGTTTFTKTGKPGEIKINETHEMSDQPAPIDTSHNDTDLTNDDAEEFFSDNTTSKSFDDSNSTTSADSRTMPPTEGWDILLVSGIILGTLVFIGVVASGGYVIYRRRIWNKPQTLSDKCSNADSSGYIDDSTMRENSEEMYSLDNDSFLNSLEAMTIQNYWTDNVKHTKL